MTVKEGANFQGMFVTLKKRINYPVERGNNSYNFFVFGYYDGMNILPISKWGYFSPSHYLEESNPNAQEDNELKKLKEHHKIELDDCILEQYAIKACLPSPDNLTDLNSKGFKYDIWENDLPDEKKREFYQEYPFVACALLHLTEEYIASCDNPEQIVLNLADEIKKLHDDISDLNCSIYFSVGYSDAVILFHVKDFECVSEVLNNLQSKETEVNSKKPIISDLYTITGFARQSFENLEDAKKIISETDINNLNNITVSFILKPGVSTHQFQKDLIENIKTYLSVFGYKFNPGVNVAMRSGAFGVNDAVIEFKLPVNIFPLLYMDYGQDLRGPFNLKSGIFKNYIVSQKASVFTEKSFELENIPYSPDPPLPEAAHNVFLSNFQEFSKENKIHMRVYVAIRQMLNTYHNLVSANHGFDIKKLIGKALNMFINNMYVCMGEIELRREEIESGQIKNAQERYDEVVTAMLKAVDDFRGYIRPFLSDLSRSDRSSIEGRGLTHPSIGTSAKLLFSYNQFINKIADCLNENEDDGKKDFSFVVVSGGCDKTVVNEIFRFIGPWNETYAHLFIITIPEISIFDIKGTLFRLSHECFHCFGDRKRKLRFEKTMSAVINYTAAEFSNALFNEKFNIKRYRDLERILVSCEKKRIILDKIDELKNRFANKFSVQLESCVKKSKSYQEMMKHDETDAVFYTSEVHIHIGKILEENFVFETGVYSEFYLSMQKEYFSCQAELLKCISEATYDVVGEKAVVFQGELLAELEYYMASDPEPRYISNSYLDYFDKVCMRFTNPECLWKLERYEEMHEPDLKRKEIEKIKISEALPYTFRELAQIFIESMCECFTDGNAIKLLNLDYADFLLSFVYETWDVYRAIPDDMVNIFRIGAALKALGVSGKLTDEQKEKIKSTLNIYKISGLKIEIDLKSFFEQTDKIISEYSSFAHCTKFVEEYWAECENNMQPITVNDINIYRECVTNEMIYKFVGLWKILAEDGGQNA